VQIKLPFKSSPQAIRADPHQLTKPSPVEKKKQLPFGKLIADIIFVSDH
jgi:hypothetical protein